MAATSTLCYVHITYVQQPIMRMLNVWHDLYHDQFGSRYPLMNPLR